MLGDPQVPDSGSTRRIDVAVYVLRREVALRRSVSLVRTEVDVVIGEHGPTLPALVETSRPPRQVVSCRGDPRPSKSALEVLFFVASPTSLTWFTGLLLAALPLNGPGVLGGARVGVAADVGDSDLETMLALANLLLKR